MNSLIRSSVWRPELSTIQNIGGWVFSVLGTVCIFWWMAWSADREKYRNIERDTGKTREEWREWADNTTEDDIMRIL